MKTEKSILAGEELAKKYYARIGSLTDKREALLSKSSERTVEQESLVEIINHCLEDLKERVVNVEQRLAKLKKQWEWEMDVNSAEANFRFNELVINAKNYIDKEPRSITDKVALICDFFYSENNTPENQLLRNNMYFQLKGHMEFLKTRYGKK